MFQWAKRLLVYLNERIKSNNSINEKDTKNSNNKMWNS